ncbi:hypothetical protein FRC06_010421, partial [Ceratobasidium sp. 370]
MDQLLEDVLNDNNPFLDENDPSVAGSEPEDTPSPALQALQYLSEHGITLARLLDDVLFGDELIRKDRLVINA